MIILPLESPNTQTISLKAKYALNILSADAPFDKFYLRRLSVTMDFVIYNDCVVNYESSQFVTSCKWFGGLNTFLSFAVPRKRCSCFFLSFLLTIMDAVGKRRELWAHILLQGRQLLSPRLLLAPSPQVLCWIWVSLLQSPCWQPWFFCLPLLPAAFPHVLLCLLVHLEPPHQEPSYLKTRRDATTAGWFWHFR